MFMAGFTSGVLFSMADGKQAESKNCPLVLTGHTCGSCAYSRQSFFQTLCWRGSLLADKHPKERKNVPALWKILSISSKKKCKKKKKKQHLASNQNYMARRIGAPVTVVDVKATNESLRATWFIFKFLWPKLWLQACFLSRKIPLSSCVLICMCNLRDIWARYGHTPPAP